MYAKPPSLIQFRRAFALWALALFLTYPLIGQDFRPVSLTAVPVKNLEYSSMEWVDYDNDGKLDFMIVGKDETNSSPMTTKLYRQGDNGTFEDKSALLQGIPGIGYGVIAWGDYDSDGRADFLMTGLTANSTPSAITRLYRQKSDGSGFENKTSLLPGVPGLYQGDAEWGDYDNDGKPDLLLTGSDNNYDGSVRLYHQKGDGSGFEDKSSGIDNAIGVSDGGISWGDFDKDGKLDFLVTGYNFRPLQRAVSKLYRQKSDGTGFEDATRLVADIPNLSQGDIDWGDYDNDGLLDFLMVGTTTGDIRGETTRLYHQRNDGSGFENKSSIIAGNVGISDGKLRWGDYDSDGKLDFLVNGFSTFNGTGGLTRLYRQKSDGSGFEDASPTISELVRVTRGGSAWGDYNNDGKLDFLLGGTSYIQPFPYWVPATRLYGNNSPRNNQFPNSPGNLRASVDLVGRTVTFQWDKAVDDTTPSYALTYNIYLKETSTGRSLMSVMADETTGFRRIVKSGSIRRTSFTFAGIEPDKTYQWSVQAIDNSFAGSAFAVPKLFGTVSTCQELQTMKAGAWNDPEVWSCGQIPDGTKAVVIQHAISIPANLIAKALLIKYVVNQPIVFGNNSHLVLGPN